EGRRGVLLQPGAHLRARAAQGHDRRRVRRRPRPRRPGQDGHRRPRVAAHVLRLLRVRRVEDEGMAGRDLGTRDAGHEGQRDHRAAWSRALARGRRRTHRSSGVSSRAPFDSVDGVQRAFAVENYIADRPLALTVMLAAQLGKPILLEGEAGVGKTDVAKVLARVLDTELIRLQCYEGLDANSTIYEWNYAKQILHIRMAEQSHESRAELEHSIFGDEFLLSRPLLRAVRHAGPRPVVLLIDEVDRADEEFEAFLLEVLSDFQVTVPEIGTFTAKQPPVVVLTSNRTRELNDALKRRCLYLWIDYPSPAKERDIVLRKVPGIEARLAEQVVGVMHTLRAVDFYK